MPFRFVALGTKKGSGEVINLKNEPLIIDLDLNKIPNYEILEIGYTTAKIKLSPGDKDCAKNTETSYFVSCSGSVETIVDESLAILRGLFPGERKQCRLRVNYFIQKQWKNSKFHEFSITAKDVTFTLQPKDDTLTPSIDQAVLDDSTLSLKFSIAQRGSGNKREVELTEVLSNGFGSLRPYMEYSVCLDIKQKPCLPSKCQETKHCQEKITNSQLPPRAIFSKSNPISSITEKSFTISWENTDDPRGELKGQGFLE